LRRKRRLGLISETVFLVGSRWVGLVVIISAGISSNAHDRFRPADFSFKKQNTLQVGRREFNLETDDGVRRFLDCSNKTPTESNKLLSPHESSIAKRDARGLRLMNQLATASLTERSPEKKQEFRRRLLEIGHAVANNHRSSVPRYVDLFQFPFLLADALNNPVGIGKEPAANQDPEASTFWQRPADIGSADLHSGFGRTNLPIYSQTIWSYAGPKKAGRNAGCELKSDKFRIKAKFAEIHSEPFNARIFHALGYNVAPTDFCAELRIKYDRRFFTEFNQRPKLSMKAGIAFIPLSRFNLQNEFNPFNFLERAVLKDGSTLNSSELRKRLFKNRKFNCAMEEQIDYIVTKNANVQIEPRDSQSIGPWDFGELGHENLRELRGAGVLAAWLGWWDSRFENTRLRVIESATGGVQLKHYFSDLGGGLGFCAGTFKRSCEKPSDFGWSFTRIQKRNKQFQIVGFEPIEDTLAFEKMTVADARWMARLIAQLKPSQIEGALTASGFSGPDIRIYMEKLLTRRSKLLKDLGMEEEIPTWTVHSN
jgi:hypothetical protein